MRTVFVLILFFSVSLLNAKDLEKVSLQLQYFHQFQFAGYYIAKEKGYYDDVGLDLDIVDFKVGINPVDEVVSGRVDFAIGRSSLISDRSKGKEISILAAILQSSPSVIMTKKSSGINTINDFKGKRISIIGTEYSDSIHALLLSKKINFDDMQVEITSDRFKRILEDKVDIISGYTSNQPYMFEKEKIEINIFDPKDYGFDFFSEVLFTKEQNINDNKDKVNNFTEATLKGWIYAFDNIDETVELILNKYNPQNKSKEALIYEANILKNLAYFKTDELGHINIDKIKRIYALYNIMGLIDKKVDIEKFIFHTDKYRKVDFLTDKEKEYLNEKKDLTICVEADYLPYESIQDDKFTGISADYLKIIAKKLDVGLKIVKSKDKTENLMLLKSKRCDIKPIMSSYDERVMPYIQTEPYLQDFFTLSTRIKEPFITDLNNYLDEKFVILKGDDALKEMIQKRYPSIKLIFTDTIDEALNMVVDSKVFGYFGNSLSSIHHIHKYFPSKLKVVNDFGIFNIGFGVVNDDEKLITILNKSLNSISEIDKRTILNHWTKTVIHEKIDQVFLWKLILIFVVILSIVIFFMLRQNRLKALVMEQKETFENLFQKSSDGILLLDDGKFYDCNESVVNMLGYKSKDEFLHTHPSELSPMFQADGSLSYDKSEEMNRIALENGSNSFEWLHTKANGKVFWVEVVLTKININSKDILHVTWRDIQKRKELKEEVLRINENLEKRVHQEVEKNREKDKQLLQQSKLAQMGEMISMIAHQWRQPLAAISATTIDMKMKIDLDSYDFSNEKEVQDCMSDFSEKLNDIDMFVHSLSNIIDDFRFFYKPSNKYTVNTINTMYKKSMKIINKSLEVQSVEVNEDLHSVRKVNMFESELMQVVLNILQNSKENFKEKNIPKPVVTIKTYDTLNSSVIEICDNGGGISSETIDKIFDPYFSTKRAKNGTGLGLYMCKMIVEEHHKGKLYATNNENGICFIIELPFEL